MQALLCKQWCEFKHLEIVEIDDPILVPGSVRIGVEYSGVSFAHSLVVAGKYQVKPPRPFVPGTEVSGVVLEVAPDVKRIKVGDHVLAIVDWGGYAEQVIAPLETVYLLPHDACLAVSLHLVTSYSTAYAALVWRANLQFGETLIVHGAGGALGLAAVDLGKALGARVIACASTQEKRNVALKQGADFVLPSSGFREPINEWTKGCGADVIFDPVGGDVFDESIRMIAPEGRIIPVGFASGRIPQIAANLILVKNFSVLGMYFGMYVKDGPSRARERFAPKVQAMMGELIKSVAEGRLSPKVSDIFNLTDYANAMGVVLERKSMGKVMLKLGGYT